MRGVGLSYRGRPLVLPPDFSIDWRIEDDLLDFDQLGQGFSWTIQIPIKGNEWVFRYGSDPANSKNRFVTFDDFAITFGGNLWWQCSFDLIRVSDEGHYYEGTLSTIDSAVFTNKDKQINTLITAQISNPPEIGYFALEAYNENPSSPVYFPFLNFENFATGENDVVNDGSIGAEYLPAFRLFYLLKVTLRAIGYELINNAVQSNSAILKVLICGNELQTLSNITGPAQIDVAKFCPRNITLIQLIRTVGFLSAATVYVSPENKTVEITSLLNRRTKTNIDLTTKISTIRPEKAPFNDIALGYPINEDERFAENPSILEGTYLGEYETLIDFLASDNTAGNYGFIETENAYYKWRDRTGGVAGYYLYAYPFIPYESGQRDKKELECPFLPVGKSRWAYRYESGNFEIEDNGSGKVRITGVSKIKGGLYEGVFEVIFQNEESPVYDLLEGNYVDITNSGSDWIDLDLNYTQPSNAKRIKARKQLDYFVPVIAATPHIGNGEPQNDKFVPRLMIYHGMQNNIPVTGTYPAASADAFLTEGLGASKEVSNFSLNLNAGKWNVVDQIWTRLLSFLQQNVRLVMTGFLSDREVNRLVEKVKIGQHLKGYFRFKSFRGRLTKSGIVDQELEGYRV